MIVNCVAFNVDTVTFFSADAACFAQLRANKLTFYDSSSAAIQSVQPAERDGLGDPEDAPGLQTHVRPWLELFLPAEAYFGLFHVPLVGGRLGYGLAGIFEWLQPRGIAQPFLPYPRGEVDLQMYPRGVAPAERHAWFERDAQLDELPLSEILTRPFSHENIPALTPGGSKFAPPSLSEKFLLEEWFKGMSEVSWPTLTLEAAFADYYSSAPKVVWRRSSARSHFRNWLLARSSEVIRE